MTQRHVLLVEDSFMDTELAREAFREAAKNCELHVVFNGTMALDYLFGRADFGDRAKNPLPELILLDLKLPDMNGVDILRRIKLEPELAYIPIIIFTSSKEKRDIHACYSSGANSYLAKPVSYAEFVVMVKCLNEYWFNFNVFQLPVAEEEVA